VIARAVASVAPVAPTDERPADWPSAGGEVADESGQCDRSSVQMEWMVSMSLSNWVSMSDLFLFHALMETTADSIYFKDRQCRLLRVSLMMAQGFGFSDPAGLIGQTDIDLFGEAFGQGTLELSE
jgi:hypothetical protein